ncbi:hypothetical protein [Taibaiella koreensis]|uniref:hypothetical protein n=1 Tax=Taibaiella koreensis TaxID=1268548 RepID=UPI0013C29F4B|nr:hypothetical protein [Taibaiella koreensis]
MAIRIKETKFCTSIDTSWHAFALSIFYLVSPSSSFLFASMFIACYGAHEKSCSAKKEAKKATKKQCSAVFLWPAHPGLKTGSNFNAALPDIGS